MAAEPKTQESGSLSPAFLRNRILAERGLS
jgi:hypothetical protein